MDEVFGSRRGAVAGAFVVALVVSAVFIPLATVSAAAVASARWNGSSSLAPTLNGVAMGTRTSDAVVPVARIGTHPAIAWSSLPSLNTGYAYFAMGSARIRGLVLAGGSNYFGPNQYTEVYNAENKNWGGWENPTHGIGKGQGVTGPDGNLYVYWSEVPATPGGSGVMFIYDPTTHRWGGGTSPPQDVNNASMAALPNGQVLVIGGNLLQSSKTLNEVYAYSPSAKAWSTLSPMPGNGCRQMAVATSPSGLVYVEGGLCQHAISKQLLIFDPASNSWTTGPSMPGTAVFAASAAFGGDGRFYVMGGTAGKAHQVAQVMVYDPALGKWAAGPSLPAASANGGAVELHAGNIVYAGGYSAAGGYLANVWELNAR